MSGADEQIRVSDTVKRELERRKRDGESYNDVLERILGETPAADFDEGFGTLADEQADAIREGRDRANEQRKDRMRRLAGEDA